MIRPRQFLATMVLGGTVALAGWGAAGLGVFGSSGIENTRFWDHGGTRGVASLIAGAGVDALLARAMAFVAAPAGPHLGRPEAAVAPSGTSIGKAAMADPDPPETPQFSAAEASVSEAPLLASGPTPPETRVQLASLSASDPVKEYPKPAMRPVETPDECLVAEICIDEYLWSLYERRPKSTRTR